ncbi:oligosaccharide flippase family protein [Pseudomonas saudiphocaensis]|uniref:oligosaccharide flippase family protein n=1 Tax=Pseudomonas saudiphocaensis TaxID=1499686 RepID=UPI000F7B9148|nr:oligosaccharide flippase family protein [Pseudomonas saudiphocaensis]RRV13648.1 hypothetical protein EGJ00_14950 [Pseudomonas saudiphocaensis]
MTRPLLKNSAWSIAGASATRAGSLLATIAAAKVSSIETFANYTISQNMVATLTAFATFGIATSCAKKIAETASVNEKKEILFFYLTTSVILLGIFCGALAFNAEYLASVVYDGTASPIAISAPALILFFSAASSVLQGALMGEQRFKEVSQSNILSAVLALLVPPIALLYSSEVGIYSLSISHLVCFILNIKQLRSCKILGFSPPSKSRLKLLCETTITFTFPAALSNLLVGPVNWAATLILIHNTKDLFVVAEYNIAYQLYAAILFVPAAISTVSLPMLARSQPEQKIKLLRSSSLLATAAAASMSIVFYTAAPLMPHVYGSEYSGSTHILQVLCIAVVLNAANLNMGSYIAAINKMWIGFGLNLTWAVTYIVFAMLLVPHLLGEGLALALLIAYTFHTIFQILTIFILHRKSI